MSERLGDAGPARMALASCKRCSEGVERATARAPSLSQSPSILTKIFLKIDADVNLFEENLKRQTAKQIAHIKGIYCILGKEERRFFLKNFSKTFSEKINELEKKASLNDGLSMKNS